MDPRLRLHALTASLFFAALAVIALFWSFPKLLVYLLLAVVAALAYGALYLVLAARFDPRELGRGVHEQAVAADADRQLEPSVDDTPEDPA